MIIRKKFYIEGCWVDSLDGRVAEVLDPSTEQPCALISLGGERDTDRAVAAAKKAFDLWSLTDPMIRLEATKRLLAIYEHRAREMAAAISVEMGAPIDMALRKQVGAGASHIKNFIAAFERFEFLRPIGPHAPNACIQMSPIGVAGLITPWNWPMNQITLKVIPAVLAGCTVVLKPSEIAPLSAMLFAEYIDEAGFPAGVFNLVNGDGTGVGARLSSHPDVEMISFTGSTRAGKAISRAAADSLKRVVLELGGKGANLIFADADPDAVRRGVTRCFNNTGQSCNAPTRMLVERSIYAQVVEEARVIAEATKTGASCASGDHLGPLASREQFDRVQALIQVGIDQGARLIAGGLGRPEGFELGYFVRPTIFADVNSSMTIAREEIFGPVLSILPFDSEEEAIAIANDTPYGLANYVQSGDGERRRRIASRLRSGMIEMNGLSRGAGAPFGGVKASGRAREGGVWGLEEFLEVKSISGWPI